MISQVRGLQRNQNSCVPASNSPFIFQVLGIPHPAVATRDVALYQVRPASRKSSSATGSLTSDLPCFLSIL